MKKFYLLSLFLGGLVCLSPALRAQTIVQVAPGNGTLNQAIETYLTDTGLPTMDVVFQLEGGGVYILTGTLENRTEIDGENVGYPLRIEAAPDADSKPIIRPGVSDDGEAFRVANIRDDFMASGVYITNEDPLGGQDDRILRVRASDVTVRLFDVHLDKASQAAIRIDDPNVSLFMDQCIVSNIINAANPSNGRGIDDRGNDIDTLHIRNTTFYNLSARVLRDDGGVIDYALIDQVTTYNTGDRILQLGRVNNATVTNSLFVNAAFLGDNESGSSVIQLDENEDFDETVTISHINFSDDPALLALFDSLNTVGLAQVFVDDGQDSVFFRTGLNEEATLFADASTIYTETIESFEDVPATPTAYVASFYTTPDDTAPIDDGNGGADPGETLLPYDFAYGTDEFIYTAGTEGQPIGDLQWFPQFLTSTYAPELAAELRLSLFPNPTAGATELRFELPQPQEVRFQLFDPLGREVGESQRAALPAGPARLALDLGDLPAGTYFYRLRAGAAFTSGTIAVR